MNEILELYWTDSYKTGHVFMLPKGHYRMASNMTARSGKLSNVPNGNKIVNTGIQYTAQQVHEDWDKNFFKRDVNELYQFKKDMEAHLMIDNYDISHMLELHKIGYLPIEIYAIEEGVLLDYRVPSYLIVNTTEISNVAMDWIVNYLESIVSAESYLLPTSATTAYAYRQLGLEYANKTNSKDKWFVDFQFHDFSQRGLGGKSAITMSGLGFAMCSKGSDNVPIIPLSRKFYDEKEVPLFSVLATEHAVMSSLIFRNENLFNKGLGQEVIQEYIERGNEL